MSDYKKLENEPPQYGDRPSFVPASTTRPSQPPPPLPTNPYGTGNIVPGPPQYTTGHPSVSYNTQQQYATPYQQPSAPPPHNGGYVPPPHSSAVAGPGYNAGSDGSARRSSYYNTQPEHFTETLEYKEANRIMYEGFFECLNEQYCLVATCFPCVAAGQIYEQSGQGSFFAGCCCHLLLCGISRSHVQRLVGAYDPGCVMNCAAHCCSPCALTQEYRAVELWCRSKQLFGPLEM